jgi:hypothetical protein
MDPEILIPDLADPVDLNESLADDTGGSEDDTITYTICKETICSRTC